LVSGTIKKNKEKILGDHSLERITSDEEEIPIAWKGPVKICVPSKQISH